MMHDGQTITDLLKLATKHVQKFGADNLVASLELEYAADSPPLYLADVLSHLANRVMTAGDVQAWWLVRGVQDELWGFHAAAPTDADLDEFMRIAAEEQAAREATAPKTSLEQALGGFPDVNTYRNYYLCNGRDDR
jgi:hypothetical protein